MKLRKQEKKRLIDLCNRYDLDWQTYDMTAYDYPTVKRMILQDAHVKTDGMVEEELAYWEAMAEYFDSRPIEEKVVAADPQAIIEQTLPVCLLVFFVHRSRMSLALKVLDQFKGNMHRFGVSRRTDKRGRPVGSGIVWMVGKRETTRLILRELGQRNIRVRVLRNSAFRRDFLHYYNGRFYGLKRKVMKQVTSKVSSKLS